SAACAEQVELGYPHSFSCDFNVAVVGERHLYGLAHCERALVCKIYADATQFRQRLRRIRPETRRDLRHVEKLFGRRRGHALASGCERRLRGRDCRPLLRRLRRVLWCGLLLLCLRRGLLLAALRS